MGDVPVSKGIPAGGQYLKNKLTLTDRQHLTLQLDANGDLKVLCLSLDTQGNVVAVDTAPVGGLVAEVVKDPKTQALLEQLVDLGLAQKDFNLNSMKPGLAASKDGLDPITPMNVNSLEMTFDSTNQKWSRNLSSPGSPGIPSISIEGTKNTYSAAATEFAPGAAATDFFVIRGSATKTVRVTRMEISGTATAAGASTVQLNKYSVFLTGGTPATSTNVPHDSKNPAATAVVTSYTAAPTVGATLVGIVRSIRPTFTTPAGAIPEIPLVMDFTLRGEQGIVLRGVNDYLAFNFNAATVVGLTVNADVTWTEE